MLGCMRSTCARLRVGAKAAPWREEDHIRCVHGEAFVRRAVDLLALGCWETPLSLYSCTTETGLPDGSGSRFWLKVNISICGIFIST